jgi:hypothetical protein
LQLDEPDMESEHGLISSLLEWAGRRVDGVRMAEAVAEGLGGAQIPFVPFTGGSPQGDMEVSPLLFPCCVHGSKSLTWIFDLMSANIFDRNVGLFLLTFFFLI